jgi:Pyruvate/2-oxoacid:ferredoxin oxidoreductase delta subunit
LEEELTRMTGRGEIWGVEMDGKKVFWLAPWVVGIYEFQIDRLDREFCQMHEQYSMYFGAQFIQTGPQIMMTIPIEEHLPSDQQALPYHQVSRIIEQGVSFRVGECICKKERAVMEHPCAKPTEVCMAILPVADVEPLRKWGRAISKEEARKVLREAERAGLVHLTGNIEKDHWLICNCCGCCCGVLRPIRQFGLKGLVNSAYRAEIDAEQCIGCGVCKEERCQVGAIVEEKDSYRVMADRCIGCGLCLTDCSVECIRLVRRPDSELVKPAADTEAWNQERARNRGVDYSALK